MGLRVESSAVKAEVEYHFPYTSSLGHDLQNGLTGREVSSI